MHSPSKPKPNKSGISPVIGIILMVVIVVIMSAVLAFYATNLSIGETQPNAVVEAQFYTQYNSQTDTYTDYMELQHRSGDSINTEDLEVQIRSNGVSASLANTENNLGTEFGPGETGSYEISSTAEQICQQGVDEAEITLVDNKSNHVVYTTDVKVESNTGVSLDGNQVGVNSGNKFTARVEVLGMGASGSGGGDIKGDVITGRIVVTNEDGSQSYLTPWPDGNPSDSINTTSPFEDDIWSPNASGISYTTKELDSEKSVSVDMRSYKPTSWTDTNEDIVRNGTTYDITKGSGGLQSDRFWVNSANEDENNLLTLKDGDSVPKLGESLAWQQSLQSMLQERMNEEGVLQLDQNEVVAVYELNTVGADPNGSGDYNDAVVLIEVTQQEEIVTKGPDRHFLYC